MCTYDHKEDPFFSEAPHRPPAIHDRQGREEYRSVRFLMQYMSHYGTAPDFARAVFPYEATEEKAKKNIILRNRAEYYTLMQIAELIGTGRPHDALEVTLR